MMTKGELINWLHDWIDAADTEMLKALQDGATHIEDSRTRNRQKRQQICDITGGRRSEA